ncbi:MAG: hypothetical protein AB7R89_09870 [Dehalococcoidia bacterium]
MREAIKVDIATRPDFERLVDEVARTQTSRVITRGDEEIAVLSPAKPKRRRTVWKRPTQADIDAALSVAGSWTDVEAAERLKRELDEARSDNSPPVQL